MRNFIRGINVKHKKRLREVYSKRLPAKYTKVIIAKSEMVDVDMLAQALLS